MNGKMAVVIGALAVGGVVAGVLAQKVPGDDVVIDRVVGEARAEDLVGVPIVVTTHEEVLTEEQVQAIIEDLKNVEANGGLLGIAERNGCSMSQVKAVLRARDARLRELAGTGDLEPGEVHP